MEESVKRYNGLPNYSQEKEDGMFVLYIDYAKIANELREIRAVCHAYDKVINSLPSALKIDFINQIPQQYRDALAKL